MSEQSSILDPTARPDIRATLLERIKSPVAAVLKATGDIAGISSVGSIVELLTIFQPRQRIDRVVDYIEILDSKLTIIEKQVDKSLSDDQIGDLLEDGAIQAAKSIYQSRRRLIGGLVANCLTTEEIRFANKKRLIEIFGTLNEIEIILLQEGSLWATEEDEFYDFHEPLWQTAEADFDAEVVEFSGATLLVEYRENLRRLNLLKGERLLTQLGELLVNALGINHEARQPGAYAGRWHDILSDLDLSSDSDN